MLGNSVWPEPKAKLVSGRSWGIMGADDIKDGVRFDRVFVINLVVFSCFTIDVKSLNCVHKFTFSGCVNYLHVFIDKPHAMIIVLQMGCKTRFPYVILKIMEMLFIPFME